MEDQMLNDDLSHRSLSLQGREKEGGALYSTRCFVEGKLQPATISFSEGKITNILFSKSADAEDLGNAVLMPGVIDAHVHINEPGRTDWEGFDTATKAAAAGGISTVIDMPLNASPVTTNLKALNEKLQAANNQLHVNVGFYGGLIPGNVSDLPALMEAGVLGIKCFLTHSGIDEFPNVTRSTIEEAMPIIAKHGLPLLAHCEMYEQEIVTDLHKYPTSYQQYLNSRPKKWENDAIAMMIELCKKYHCKTHIVHVSSAEALQDIKDAKASGCALTAETCSHYILFAAEQIPDGNTLFKCAPPIREKENNALLKQALVDGVLDFITTDHSPAPPSIKEINSGNLQKAWGGIAGLQFLLPSAYTAMKEICSLEKFIPLLTEHPAAFLKLQNRKGFLKPGYDADLVIWNPEESFEVKAENILHRHNCSAYCGEQLLGSVQQTIVNGHTVYKRGAIVDQSKKHGTIILAKNNNL
jgi:allantoinase